MGKYFFYTVIRPFLSWTGSLWRCTGLQINFFLMPLKSLSYVKHPQDRILLTEQIKWVSIWEEYWLLLILRNGLLKIPITTWKVSKYGIYSGPYFPIFKLNTGKCGPEKTPYLETFHTVYILYCKVVWELCYITKSNLKPKFLPWKFSEIFNIVIE